MMDDMELGLYHSMPVQLQNLAVTYMNCRQLWRKFGYFKGGSEKVPPKMPGEPILWLRAFLEYARQNSVYYRDVLPSVTDTPEGDGVASVLKDIPILSKTILRTATKSIISRQSHPFNSQPFRTSGSTGAPIRGVISLRDLRARYTAIWRSFAPFGMCPSRRWARFVGLDITQRPERGIFRKDFINDHLFLSVYHLSKSSIRDYVCALKRFGAEILEGYPSAIATLARLIVEAGESNLRIPAIFVTAETLLPEQAEVIKRGLGTRPMNYYASSEFSPLLAEKADGLMHLVPETGLVEVLNQRNEAVRAGEIGRMVVTSFHSHFTPLIRYDIGDMARVAAGGPSDLVVSELLGRIDDVVVTPDGRYVGRLSTAMKKLPQTVEIAQCRVKGSHVRVLYVARSAIARTEFNSFAASMHQKMGPVHLTFERVTDIPLGSRGKRQTLIQES